MSNNRVLYLATSSGTSPFAVINALKSLSESFICFNVNTADNTKEFHNFLEELVGAKVKEISVDDDICEILTLLDDFNITKVIGFDDRVLGLVSQISNALTLGNANSAEVSDALMCKSIQRSRLSPEISTNYQAFKSSSSILKSLNLVYPLVLKPCLGGGSVNTFYIPNEEKLKEVLELVSDDIVTPGKDGNRFILEEYLDGEESYHNRIDSFVSVESIVVDGLIHHVAVADKGKLRSNFRERGSIFPSQRSREVIEEIKLVASQAINSLQVKWGCVHTEIKLTCIGPRVIEVNGRIGGSFQGLLKSFGYCMVTEYLSSLDGKSPNKLNCHDKLVYGHKISIDNFEKVKILSMNDRVNLDSLEGVVFSRIYVNQSDNLDVRDGALSNIGVVTIESDSLTSLFKIEDMIYDSLKIKYEEL